VNPVAAEAGIVKQMAADIAATAVKLIILMKKF
jgi:hypothetical protein